MFFVGSKLNPNFGLIGLTCILKTFCLSAASPHDRDQFSHSTLLLNETNNVHENMKTKTILVFLAFFFIECLVHVQADGVLYDDGER